MTTEKLSTLKIHKLSLEQYQKALAAGDIDENALYFVSGEIPADGDVVIDATLTIDGAAANAKAVGDALERKAAKPLTIYADNAPNTGANSASGIPIFTIDYSPSDLKAHADAGGSVTIVRDNRQYLMYEATDEEAKFRFIEPSDAQMDGYHAILDANRRVTITKTTHKSNMETTAGGQVGQVPVINGLTSKGLPNKWQFVYVAPGGYVDFKGTVNTYAEFAALVDNTFNSIDNNNEYRLFCAISSSDGAVPAGSWFVSIKREWEGYGVVEIVNDSYKFERRLYAGTWGDWRRSDAAAFDNVLNTLLGVSG